MTSFWIFCSADAPLRTSWESALYLFIKDWEKNRWFKYAFFLPLTAICVTLWSVDSLAITDTVEVEEIWVVFSLTIQINLLSSSDSDNRSDSRLWLPCSEWENGHIWYLWHRRRLKIRCWCINYDYMCAFLWLGSLAFPKLTRFRSGQAATSACLNKGTVFISD